MDSTTLLPYAPMAPQIYLRTDISLTGDADGTGE
jgi:hypothetical protein